ncbi:MAG: PilC/PilY family type IV pilus protein [Desulfobulbaceae bacterium]
MKRHLYNLAAGIALFGALFTGLSSAQAAMSTCSEGIGEPPFLSFGVKSNLLIVLDNSGSMYDPAYVETAGTCEDSAYDPATLYAGYFDATTWYTYNQANGQFEQTTDALATAACTAAVGTKYSKAGTTCITVNQAVDPSVVNSFAALGNFLNWAAASKFDTQKKILTGGKWDEDPDNSEVTTNDGQLIMESRGCMNRRFIKQIPLDQFTNVDSYYLTLAIRPPMEEIFDIWEDGTSYAVGDRVQYRGVPYEATMAHTSGVLFDENKWTPYLLTRWYPDVTYPPFTVVYDPLSKKMYRTEAGGTSLATATRLSEDTAVDWAEYNTTHLEMYDITVGGFNNDACMLALAELENLTGVDDNSEKTRLGQLKAYTEECMGYDQGAPNTEEGYKKSAFNHSMQECWYFGKFGHWQPGSGTVSSLKSSCEGMYQTIHPQDLSPSDSGYICGGAYGSSPPYGYVGRCWEPPLGLSGECNNISCDASTPLAYNQRCSGGIIQQCDNWNSGKNECKKVEDWYSLVVCIGGGDLTGDEIILDGSYAAPGGWTNDNFTYRNPCDYKYCEWNYEVINDCPRGAADTYSCTVSSAITALNATTWTCYEAPTDGNLVADNCFLADPVGDRCVDQALKDFCGQVEVPEVIDPSDSTGLTEEVWNAPAMLTDSGLLGQLDQPILTMLGHIAQPTAPSGILHKAATDLRIGVMAFNHNGAKTECDALAADPAAATSAISYDCPDENRDGAQLLANIKLGTAKTAVDRTHVDDLVDSINAIKATSWTPLAEAMYNVLGYYTQDTVKRLNPDDFLVESEVPDWDAATSYEAGAIVGYGDKYWLALTPIAAGGVNPEADELNWTETEVDPVTSHCQENYVLTITEGASTADINPTVQTFALAHDDGDDMETTTIPNGECTDGLKGSTYLDDLTGFGYSASASELYPAGKDQILTADGEWVDKPNITSFFVVSGSGGGDMTDECDQDLLMLNASLNGSDTEPTYANNPTELERRLLEIFNALRVRASAGSAASVISSARGGEGAIYQAIFWPELVRNNGADIVKIAWAGDVHGLFLDNYGFMYEDTDGNRAMNPGEDLDSDGHADTGEDANHNGVLDLGEDLDGDGVLDLTEDLDGDNNFDIGEDRNNNGILDIGEDVDGDGQIDLTEDLNGDGSFDPATEDIDGDGHFDAVNEDLDGDGNFDYIFEDVNQNGTVTAASDGADRRIIIYYDTAAERSRACLNTSYYDTLGQECTDAIELDQVRFLWSASEWLSDYPVRNPSLAAADQLNPLTTVSNRTVDNYISNQRQRYIFTWNDRNRDGIADSSEVVNFESATDWTAMAGDFDLPDDPSVDTLINWLRGADSVGLRSRNTGYIDDAGTFREFTWRLGDIIHSTPMTVAAPAEGYHLIYNDFSYAQFLAQYKGRRHVVYFGANDGMLHAVNAGFYSEKEKKFCLVPLASNGTCPANDGTANAPALGAELWAYVPHNLQPHLNCLTDPVYKHKYFVDQRPRIFDAQIFANDADHPSGWGTILVGALRFGGAPINADTLEGHVVGDDSRQFTSSYFILDITNPEVPPKLLGELTHTTTGATVDLGYSTVIPTMVIMKDDNNTPEVAADDTNKWYLVFGSGPHGENALKGVSDQEAKIAILPLDGLATGTRSMRFPTTGPDETTPGTIPLPDSPNGFVSDPITVDFDINPSYQEYKADAVYFGTVETTNPPFGFNSYVDESTYWDGGGHMYRLVMEPTGHFLGIEDEPVTTPDQWGVTKLLDLSGAAPNSRKQPITAAASVGTDKTFGQQANYNYWIYFGTGRFFDPDDKTDIEQQSYFGIKEPMVLATYPLSGESKLKLTWDEVEMSGVPTNARGDKGLMKVDEIMVYESLRAADAQLACRDNATGLPLTGDYSCMADFTVSSADAYFDKLEKYIAGTGTCTGSDYTDNNYKNNCVDGWYLDFWPYENRERNVGQATLLGGLVTFTTYQPFSDVCKAEGNAYLYGVYYRTGTAWYENIFGAEGITAGTVESKLDLGKGLATTPNLHVGATGDDSLKAFVQTSTGEIKEIKQENLPVKNFKTGRSRWKEYIRD